MITMADFVGWLATKPDEYKFYDGNLCETCLVGKYGREKYDKQDLAFEGSRLVVVDAKGFLTGDEPIDKVDLELKKFVSGFDALIGVWGNGTEGYVGPFDNITAGKVKDFLERG